MISFGWPQALFIITSMKWTILLTIVCFLTGGFAGLFIAIARSSPNPALRYPAEIYIGIVQGIPVLMVLFLSFFGLAFAGLDLSPFAASSVSLSIYTSAYLGDIWRGSIQSVPKQQWEASASLALSRFQQYRYIILPQAVRVSLPPTASFLVHLVKNTSIVSIVGYVELTRAGQLVNNATFSPFKTFGLVAICYIAICYPLTRLSARLERRFKTKKST